MTATSTSLADEVSAALSTVVDPELDEPITELGFVASVACDDVGVAVHLRLPTAFCAPNFAYLMVADAYDALEAIPGIGTVQVFLDGHHDSEKINAGTAARLGYRGTFGAEAEDSLDQLRETFRIKAHTAALERCCMLMLRRGTWTLAELPLLELADLPAGAQKSALLRRRAAIGLPVDPHALVLVGPDGRQDDRQDVAQQLRLAALTRISIEGNAHFCRGLLATRYGDGANHTGRETPTLTGK